MQPIFSHHPPLTHSLTNAKLIMPFDDPSLPSPLTPTSPTSRNSTAPPSPSHTSSSIISDYATRLHDFFRSSSSRRTFPSQRCLSVASTAQTYHSLIRDHDLLTSDPPALNDAIASLLGSSSLSSSPGLHRLHREEPAFDSHDGAVRHYTPVGRRAVRALADLVRERNESIEGEEPLPAYSERSRPSPHSEGTTSPLSSVELDLAPASSPHGAELDGTPIERLSPRIINRSPVSSRPTTHGRRTLTTPSSSHSLPPPTYTSTAPPSSPAPSDIDDLLPMVSTRPRLRRPLSSTSTSSLHPLTFQILSHLPPTPLSPFPPARLSRALSTLSLVNPLLSLDTAVLSRLSSALNTLHSLSLSIPSHDSWSSHSDSDMGLAESVLDSAKSGDTGRVARLIGFGEEVRSKGVVRGLPSVEELERVRDGSS